MFSIKEYVKNAPLFLIAGPCVIQTKEICFEIAKTIKSIGDELEIPVVFKASFDKANRTSGDSYRGPGLEEGLAILEAVKKEFGLPLLTDVHETSQVKRVAEVCDILQIPAFLCRQTDLTEAAAATGKTVNIKKGQFMSPWATKHLVDKARAIKGSSDIMLTERGASFGYGNLVVDMRSFPIMDQYADMVVYDATHSLQLPSSGDGRTSGQREYVPALAKAAVATGSVHGLFLEVHPNPKDSPSDADNILPLEELKPLMVQLKQIKEIVSCK